MQKIVEPIETDLLQVKEVLVAEVSSAFPELGGVVRDFLGHYGKLLRPVLVLLCARACGVSGALSQKTINVAATIEMVHAATLIHDDVIDRATSRHGRESLYHSMGAQGAVLVGDFLFSKALRVSSKCGAYAEIDMVVEAIEKLVEGELLQSQLAGTLDLSQAKYYDVVRLKTASLIEAAARVGASTAGGADVQSAALVEYAGLLGTIFQIQDDVMDYSPSLDTGKASYNDIMEQKMTLPLLLAIERGGGGVIDDFRAKNIEGVANFIAEFGGVEQAVERMEQLAAQAVQKLSVIEDSPAKTGLIALLKFAAKRTN